MFLGKNRAAIGPGLAFSPGTMTMIKTPMSISRPQIDIAMIRGICLPLDRGLQVDQVGRAAIVFGVGNLAPERAFLASGRWLRQA